MNLILFKYGLPVIIGYVLFIGISGRFRPLRKPPELPQRPSWLLGLWAGVSVTLTLMLVLNLAYHLPANTEARLFWPSASLLATLIVPGLAVYFWYRNTIAAELLDQHRRENAVKHAHAELQHFQQTQSVHQNEGTAREPVDARNLEEQLEAAETLAGDELATTEPAADSVVQNRTDEDLFDRAFDKAFAATSAVLKRDSTTEYDDAFDRAYAETSAALSADKTESGTVPQQQLQIDLGPEHNAVSADDKNMNWPVEQHAGDALATAQQQAILEQQLFVREQVVRNEMQSAMTEQLKLKTAEFEKQLVESQEIAESEATLRGETEQHLRVTRKAMIKLESDLQKLEATRADKLIALEAELEEKIRSMSKAEASAVREQQQRSALESDLTRSRQELLDAKTELRKNTAARAKALASANKAVAYARQAVAARAKTESELSTLKDRVLTQQTTISSLIKALDTEKTRHREEIAQLQSEFAVRESELEIEGHSRQMRKDAANQPFTRLVKKVAKARPVT